MATGTNGVVFDDLDITLNKFSFNSSERIEIEVRTISNRKFVGAVALIGINMDGFDLGLTGTTQARNGTVDLSLNASALSVGQHRVLAYAVNDRTVFSRTLTFTVLDSGGTALTFRLYKKATATEILPGSNTANAGQELIVYIAGGRANYTYPILLDSTVLTNLVTNSTGSANYTFHIDTAGNHSVSTYDTNAQMTWMVTVFIGTIAASYTLLAVADHTKLISDSDPVLFNVTASANGIVAQGVTVTQYVDNAQTSNTAVSDAFGHAQFTTTFSPSTANHVVYFKAGSSQSNTITVGPNGGGFLGSLGKYGPWIIAGAIGLVALSSRRGGSRVIRV